MVDRIISPLIAVHEPTSVCQIIKHRYQKGRYLKLYKKIYGQVPQVNVTKRLEVYRENFDKIIRNPVVFGALLLLKFFDLAAFYFGSLFPIADRSKSGADNYKDRLIAEAFDKQQLSPYARLKHHWEARALLSTLKKDQPKSKILELGAGTGRITKILINQGYRVTPVDISKTMIKEYLKKTGLPKPILIKKGRLPFSNNSFDTVVATRVIWHITDKKEWEKFFHEAVRVTKKDILMDFAMVKRGLNSFFSHDYFFTMQEIKTLAKANKLKITSIKWLPLGRLLIKFSHAS